AAKLLIALCCMSSPCTNLSIALLCCCSRLLSASNITISVGSTVAFCSGVVITSILTHAPVHTSDFVKYPLAPTRTACTSHYRLPHPLGALPLPASSTHTLRHAWRCAQSAYAVSQASRLLTMLPTLVTGSGVAGWHA